GSMPKAEFDRLMPTEFWRDVVDRVAAEAPDTLLLAEAFWLLEGYFVRTLGMHRVYNSAFMHMLRDEDNAGYRRVMKDTLEFDPEILKRYVNFMNNPDERTAVEQFGKGDKYFGVATLLATLPGLPMIGHGQFEGFAEKYGMEFRRASIDEPVDEWLVARHDREIVPLLHRRGDFADVRDFLLYDVMSDGGGVDENVFAYSNGSGPSRSLVVFHNRYAEAAGWVRDSTPYAVKEADGSKRLVRRSLADGLRLGDGDDLWLAFREQRSGLEYLRSGRELRERGLHVTLHAYECQVIWDLRELRDTSGIWARLAGRLGGAGVASLEDALRELELAPVHHAVRGLANDPALDALVREGAARPPDRLRDHLERLADAVLDATGTAGDTTSYVDVASRRLSLLAERAGGAGATAPGDGARPPRSERDGAASARPPVTSNPVELVAPAFADPWHRAVLAGWSIFEPLGRLARGAIVGPTSRAWYDELRLGPIVAGSLRDRGLDEAQAWAAADRIRLLLALARPSNAT
ncbi:MAG: alpha-amylase, partial [Chloroflexota bacterium]